MEATAETVEICLSQWPDVPFLRKLTLIALDGPQQPYLYGMPFVSHGPLDLKLMPSSKGPIILLSWELRIRLKVTSHWVARKLGIFYLVEQRSTLSSLSNRNITRTSTYKGV